MKHLRLHHISDDYFQTAWALYLDAFPEEERRLLEAQEVVMRQKEYHFDVVIDNKKLIGFLLWWDFKSYRYIEHFATVPAQRNKGFGRLILERFMISDNKPMLLEVELPTSTINQRRINFYERQGFILNQHYYEVPPVKNGQAPLQLLLMSYPNKLSLKDVAEFVKIVHPIIFNDASGINEASN